jgi:uncharacterized protein YbjT (DUF2867 family)
MIWRGLSAGLKNDRSLQVIALDDAGAFAAHVFDNPRQFIGKDIEIAGDEVTLEQLSQAYQRIMGKAPKTSKLRVWLLTRMGDFGKFIVNIPGQPSHADIASLRASYPKLRKLEEAMRAIKPMQYPSR